MKKSKLVTTIGMLCLSATFIASCSGYVKSKGPIVLIYNGEKYSAEELFGSQKTPTAAEAKFNAVYKVAVRNFFKDDTSLNDEVTRETKVKVAGQKSTASSNADKNGTSYDTEWQKILDSNKVDDEQGLYDKFEYEVQKEKFEDKFYKDNLSALRDGGELQSGVKIDGYLKKRQPYHVKQILIKIAGGKDKDFTNCQITKDESIKINKVITALAEGTPFSEVARMYSDDTATKEKGGDLGIMDRDTSYVNDFKLGLYLYESFIGSSTSNPRAEKEPQGTYKAKYAKSELGLTDSTTKEQAGYYADQIITNVKDPTAKTNSENTIGAIPFESALMLGEGNVTISGDTTGVSKTVKGYADVDFKSQHFDKVANVTDNATYYPRNVIFNKYFNKHNLMVITPTRVKSKETVSDPTTTPTYRKADDNYTPEIGSLYSDEYKGFQRENNNRKNDDKVLGYDSVLRDEKGRVILVFRSGNGTGEGSYQGIHFVVVERSPFIGVEYKNKEWEEKEKAEEKYGVSLSEYYTNYYPGQDGGSHPYYPAEGSKTAQPKDTFVSYFANMQPADLATRANDVKTKIKGYNPNLNTYIYNYLVNKGNIQFTAEAKTLGIDTTIKDWIDMKIESTEYDAKKSWNDSWKAYYTELEVQNKKREPQIIGKSGDDNVYKYGTVTEKCAELYVSLDGEKSGDTTKIQNLFGNGGVFHE